MPLLLLDDRNKLTLSLKEAFPTEHELDQFTDLALDVPLHDITESARMPVMIKRVIEWFEARGQIEELIQEAIAERPNVDTLRTYGTLLLKRLREAAGADWYRPPPDPHDTCFVTGQRPFISRKQLRDFLRTIAQVNGPAVLIVNGLTQAGKTYSLRLIESVRWMLQRQGEFGFALAQVDLRDEVASAYRPEDLARAIAMMLSWDVTTMPKRPSTRYAKELVQWLAGQSLLRATTSVIVLDEFHRGDLYDESRELVQQLIRQVSGGTSNLRLVLLNFVPSVIPPGVEAYVTHDSVATLTTADMTEFFTTLYEQKGLIPNPVVIDAIVQGILQNVQATAPNFNEQVNNFVKSAAEKLR